jgi:hypothetical protein
MVTLIFDNLELRLSIVFYVLPLKQYMEILDCSRKPGS